MGEKMNCNELSEVELTQVCAGVGIIETKSWFGAAEGGNGNDGQERTHE